VFSVGFRFSTIGTDVGEQYFASVLFGMKVLALHATMPDAMDFVEDASSESIVIGLAVTFFMLLAALTLMNMLIGVLCEVIGVVSAVEKESARVQLVKDNLVEVLKINGVDLGEDPENKIVSRQEFQDMLLHESVVKILRGVGVDPIGLIDFIDYIFSADEQHQEEHGLTFFKLVELICSLGGSNTATVKDVIDMRQVMMRQLASIEDRLEHGQLQNCSFAKPSQANTSWAGNCHSSHPLASTPTLEPADIDAFLKNAASIWIAQSRVGLGGAQDHLSASAPGDASWDLKATDTNGSVVQELRHFVKDLQARLEQTQGEMKATRRQLDIFKGRQHTSVRSKIQVGSSEGHTRAMETAHSAQAMEAGLSSLRTAGEQNSSPMSRGQGLRTQSLDLEQRFQEQPQGDDMARRLRPANLATKG